MPTVPISFVVMAVDDGGTGEDLWLVWRLLQLLLSVVVVFVVVVALFVMLLL